MTKKVTAESDASKRLATALYERRRGFLVFVSCPATKDEGIKSHMMSGIEVKRSHPNMHLNGIQISLS